MFKKICIAVLLVVLAAFVFAGCQTVQGIGGDIKWAGEKGAEILQ